jgi:fibronectin-binding autotransporter adhesin
MSGAVTVLNSSNQVIGTHDTIQEAVDAAGSIAGSGKTIVADGSLNGGAPFVEQVTVDAATQTVTGALDGLTIQGINGAVLQAPTTGLVSTATDPTSGTDLDGVLTINGINGVTVEGMTVDGNTQGANFAAGQNNPSEVGILVVNATGTTVTGDTVENVFDPASFGDQRNFGIYAVNAPADAGNTVTIENSTVQNFQKSGILVEYAAADVQNNTVIGVVNDVTAQNGIEIGYSTGEVTGNTVESIGYTYDDGTYTGSGILEYDGSDLSISGNTVTLSSDTTLDVAGRTPSTVAFTDGIDALSFGPGAQNDVSITDNTINGAGPTSDPNLPVNGIYYTDGTNGGTIADNAINNFNYGITIAADFSETNGQPAPETAAPSESGNTFGDNVTTDQNGPVNLEDGSGNIIQAYQTIQAAVDAWSAGDPVDPVGGTYAEQVALDGATLNVGSSTVTVDEIGGSGAIEVGAGGTLIEGDSDDFAFSGTISGTDLNTDSVAKTGSDTLALNNVTATDVSIYVIEGNLSSTGTDNLSYLVIGEGPGSTATGSIASGASLTAGALHVGDYGGTGTFEETGGTVTVDGSLNVGNQGGTGTYELSGGTLALAGAGPNLDVIGRNTSGNPGGTGTIDISGTGLLDVEVGSELILGSNSSATTEGTGKVVQTGGVLEVDAGGALYLSAYGDGEYDLDGGTLEIGGSSSLFANYNGTGGTATFDLGGGTIEVTGSELTTDADITLTAGTTSELNLGALGADFTGSVTGAGNLEITGSGTATFADLSTTGDLDLDGATLNVGSTTATVGQLDGTGTIELSGGALIEGDATDSAFSGTISGTNLNSNGVEKTGSDTLTLDNVTATGVSIYVTEGDLSSTGTDNFDYLAIGEGPGSTATASFDSGASLTIGPAAGGGALQVGDFGGTGTFDQTGGTVTVLENNSLNVGNQGGTGTYELSGGQLVLGLGLDDIGRNTSGHSAGSGTMDISGSGVLELQSGAELILGDRVSATGGESTGKVVQTGGTLQVDAGGQIFLSAYGNGEYDLDGGTLEVGGSSSLILNYAGTGTGTFDLGGGTIEVTGSQLTTNANIALTAGTTSTLDVGTLGADFTGSVTGAGNLEITGSGTATFADLSTTGDLDLDGATLNVGSTTATVGQLDGTGTIELSGGALIEGDATDSAFSGTISGTNLNSNGVEKTGSDTLTLDNVTATGVSIYVSEGDLSLTGTDNLSYLAVGEGTAGTAGIAGGASLTISGSQAALQVGDYGGTGTFEQTGGTVTVDGSLNVGNQGGTGTYELSEGQLTLGTGLDDIGRNTGSNPAGSGTLDISGGGVLELQSGAELILGDRVSATGGESTGKVVQTGGVLEVDAGGALYLSAYGDGEYDLNGGTLEIGGGSSLFANYNGTGGTATFDLGGGTIEVTGSELTTNADITLTAGTTSELDVGTLGADFTGSVTGAGNLEITGSGTATFADLSTTGDLDLDGATLNVGSTTATVGQLDGSGTVEIGAGGDLVVGDATDSIFSGTITGTNFNTDTVAKVGSDTLTLDNVTSTGVQILAYQGSIAITGADTLSYVAIGEGGDTATASIGDGASLTIDGVNGAGHAGALQVGDFGGTGTFEQTGGTVTVTGNNALNVGNQGGTGTYELSGGTLQLGAIDVIGRNTSNHAASHGTIDLSGTGLLDVEAGGELILGDNNSAPAEGSGTITQTGGVLEVDAGGALYLSAYGNGEYDLDGGTLEIGGSNSLFANYNGTGGTATFDLGGGTIEVTGSELTTNANITLTGGTTSELNFGGLGADLTGALSGSGNLDITGPGVATLSGNNSGFSGGITIADGTLELANPQAAGTGPITFSGDPTLEIDGSNLPTDPSLVLSQTIYGFAQGDAIDLTGIAYNAINSVTLSGSDELQLTENGETYDFQLAGDFNGDTFQAIQASGTGTEIIVNNTTPCYCRGTMILTVRGEIPVEALEIGDHLVTLSGATKQIKWIGRRSYDGRFVKGKREVLPIVIAAGALGDGVPWRDLWVSPEHALYLDGSLVPAKLLVNGMTITQVDAVSELEYFHIEVEPHDVIYAEGAPAETYIECNNRLVFQNAQEFAALYPDARNNTGEFYAARLEDGDPSVKVIHARLLARAAELGHRTTDDPGVHLVADGIVIEASAAENGVHRFALSQVPDALYLASRSTVPAETDAAARDRRRLGVCLRRITLSNADLTLDLDPDHHLLRDGFHEVEGEHRWTAGLAQLPATVLDLFPGPLSIEIATWPSQLRYTERAA